MVVALWRMRNDLVFKQRNPNFNATLKWLRQVQKELIELPLEDVDTQANDEMKNVDIQQNWIKPTHSFLQSIPMQLLKIRTFELV